MIRYFFDTNDGHLFVKDEEGLDLRSPQEARVQAQSVLAELAREKIVKADSQWSMTTVVRDETGKTVVRAALSLVVQSEP